MIEHLDNKTKNTSFTLLVHILTITYQLCDMILYWFTYISDLNIYMDQYLYTTQHWKILEYIHLSVSLGVIGVLLVPVAVIHSYL